MKQTAVEWFIEKVGHNSLMSLTDYNEILEQAKEMERDQIKDAWLNSLTKGDFNSADEYYNQTYKSEQ
jgi:hypothetical protein